MKKKLPYNIKIIDLKEINSVEELHLKLKETLDFPDDYKMNWDAFWDTMTGLTEVPTNIFLYKSKSFKNNFEEDYKKFIRLIFDFNDLQKHKVIQFDFEPHEEVRFVKPSKKTSIIFRKRPIQWGLRGDKHLWSELETEFSSIEIPNSELELYHLILQSIQNLTGQNLEEGKNFFIKRYNTGGMSGGQVCSDFWLKRGLPILIARFRKMKK